MLTRWSGSGTLAQSGRQVPDHRSHENHTLHTASHVLPDPDPGVADVPHSMPHGPGLSPFPTLTPRCQ